MIKKFRFYCVFFFKMCTHPCNVEEKYFHNPKGQAGRGLSVFHATWKERGRTWKKIEISRTSRRPGTRALGLPRLLPVLPRGVEDKMTIYLVLGKWS